MTAIVQPPNEPAPAQKVTVVNPATPASPAAGAPGQGGGPAHAAAAVPAPAAPAAAARPAGATAAFDDDAHPVFDAPPLETARPAQPSGARRGRPRQAFAQVLAPAGEITKDDFALLRAWVQGVPLARAGRYVTAQGSARSAAKYVQRLLARVHAGATQLPDAQAQAMVARLLGTAGRAGAPALARDRAVDPAVDPAAHPAPVARRAAGVPAQAPAPAPAAGAPAPRRPALTLEEFAARFDDGMYSERELVELYLEEVGGQPPEQQGSGSAAPPRAPSGQGGPSGQGTSVDASAHLRSVVAAAAARAGEVRAAGAADSWGPGAIALAAPAPASVSEKLAILDWLAPRLARSPSGNAAMAAWLEPELAQCLQRALQVQSLSQLVGRINALGRWWWKSVPGLGRSRARRLLQWLAEQQLAIGVPLDERVLRELQGGAGHAASDAARAVATGQAVLGQAATAAGQRLPAASPAPVATSKLALAPLVILTWPQHLRGCDGVFRGEGPNALGAADDVQAVQAWLSVHLRGKSKATTLVYTRAVERLVLWALCERGAALSCLTCSDLAAFAQFLEAPPEHWCGADRVVKGSAQWRPLRGALSPVAVNQVMTVVRQMFRDWQRCGYLRVDAAALVGMAAAGAAPAGPARLDVTRAFDERHLQAMRRELNEMPEGAQRRRLRAILLLLLETGMRRSEAAALTFGDIEGASAAHGQPGDCQVRVVGKRGRLRVLPLRAPVLKALLDHLQDRMALAQEGRLPASILTMPRSGVPVLGVLHWGRPAGRPGRGDSAAAAPRNASPAGGLAGASLHGILKAFFARVAARGDLAGERAAFVRASAHFLRHTFAHRVLAVGRETALPVAQALLGHASLVTTGHYLQADLTERFRTVAEMDEPF